MFWHEIEGFVPKGTAVYPKRVDNESEQDEKYIVKKDFGTSVLVEDSQTSNIFTVNKTDLRVDMLGSLSITEAERDEYNRRDSIDYKAGDRVILYKDVDQNYLHLGHIVQLVRNDKLVIATSDTDTNLEIVTKQDVRPWYGSKEHLSDSKGSGLDID